jgi:hypothetical protein
MHMQVQSENQSVLTREIKIVPTWAWGLAAIVFVAAQWFFNIAMVHHSHPIAAWARPLLGILAGVGGGAYLLLLGYVNRDAKRRGMSPTLWTLVAILIPNALGILLYFVLRQPLTSGCPQCGTHVQIDFNFCPRCNCKLSMSCQQCKRPVRMEDVYCPFCGTSLRNQGNPVTNSATKLSG